MVSVVATMGRPRKWPFFHVSTCPVSSPTVLLRTPSTHDQPSQPLSSQVRTEWDPFTSVDRVERFSRQLMTPTFIVHTSAGWLDYANVYCCSCQPIKLGMTEKGRCVVKENGDIMLPQSHDVYKPSHTASYSRCTESNAMGKHKRIGKGSHILPIVRRCLQETENWKHKQDYHFPGVYTNTCQHINNNLFYTDYTQLEHSAHFMWRDILFSKDPLNKDRKIEVEINGKEEKLWCEYTAPVCDKWPCPQHNNPLTKTSSCPVEFHLVDNNDKRRWIGGLIRCPKESTDSLHNHSVHAPIAIAQWIKE